MMISSLLKTKQFITNPDHTKVVLVQFSHLDWWSPFYTRIKSLACHQDVHHTCDYTHRNHFRLRPIIMPCLSSYPNPAPPNHRVFITNTITAVRVSWQSGAYFSLGTCLTVVPKAKPMPKQHWSVDNRPAVAPAVLFVPVAWTLKSWISAYAYHYTWLGTSSCSSGQFQGQLHQNQGLAPGANVGSLKLPRTEPRDGCYRGSVQQVEPKPAEHQRKTQFRQSLSAHYQTSLGTRTAYTSYQI